MCTKYSLKLYLHHTKVQNINAFDEILEFSPVPDINDAVNNVVSAV